MGKHQPPARTDANIALRLSWDLVESVDAYAARRCAEAPGLSFSRNRAICHLITVALEKEAKK